MCNVDKLHGIPTGVLLAMEYDYKLRCCSACCRQVVDMSALKLPWYVLQVGKLTDGHLALSCHVRVKC